MPPPWSFMGIICFRYQGCQPVQNICWSKWLGLDLLKQFVITLHAWVTGPCGVSRTLTRGGLRSSCCSIGMPKRGRARHSGVCPGTGLESVESRVRRLLGPSAVSTPPLSQPLPSMPSGTNGGGPLAASSAAGIPNRRDAPVVRNLLRGSVTAAVARWNCTVPMH